ncbi:MAG: helix-turn-helix transcriptional regulator [Firmicutes bacterium]|nr:helix-turn-helix transcriptional regulator [Bacillota bacterium]
MIQSLASRLGDDRWLIASTVVLFGWLEGFLIEILRLTHEPFNLGGTTLVLATVAVVFAAAGLAVRSKWAETHHQWIVYTALPWAALFLALGWQFASGALWASMEVAAILPPVVLWLSRLPLPLAHRNQSFLISWVGMTIMAGVLVMLTHAFPGEGRTLYAFGMLPMQAAAFILPAPHASRRSLRPLRPNRVGGAAIGLFFVLGLGSSEATRWASSAGSLSWPATVLVSAASLLVLLALPFALRRTRHLLGYLSAVFLAVSLLGFFDPGTRAAVLGPQFLMLVAANLLALWWAVSLMSSLRRAPSELALALSVTTVAIALGWGIPAVTGRYSSWLLVAVVLVVIATPLLLMSGEFPSSPTSSTFRGNPDTFFDRAKLTPQERRIVQLLMQGKSNQAILQELYVSINTLKTHLKNIYRKTETKNRHELLDLIGQQHSQSAGQ